MSNWIDLLDPTDEEIRAHAPGDLEPRLLDLFTRRADPVDAARPFLRGFGTYVAGTVVAAVLDADRDRLYYQEVDLIVTRERVVTIRKTPDGEEAYDPQAVHDICAQKQHASPGMVAYYLFEDVAERYLDLVDGLDDEVDELEEHITSWPSDQIRRRLSELRHDLLRIRRTLSPTRDAVRGVVDGRVDIDAGLMRREIFPEEIERSFGTVHDKLLRASESLDYTRDLLAAARDHHSSEIATEQNEVIKRLTVIASLLLFPTFIVGLYGQNFHNMPELRWHFGYAFSWLVIIAVTVGQLAFFRWKKWI
ncbi:MAG: magnesium transporter CorA family protein [Gaiellaceae bacterium]